jgi:hypothetical protein
VFRVLYIVRWRGVGKVKRCVCWSRGERSYYGGDWESCKEIEEAEREEGKKIWCIEDYED